MNTGDQDVLNNSVLADRESEQTVTEQPGADQSTTPKDVRAQMIKEVKGPTTNPAVDLHNYSLDTEIAGRLKLPNGITHSAALELFTGQTPGLGDFVKDPEWQRNFINGAQKRAERTGKGHWTKAVNWTPSVLRFLIKSERSFERLENKLLDPQFIRVAGPIHTTRTPISDLPELPREALATKNSETQHPKKRSLVERLLRRRK